MRARCIVVDGGRGGDEVETYLIVTRCSASCLLKKPDIYTTNGSVDKMCVSKA